MNIQQPTPMTPLRARMIADMSGRNLGPASQSSHQRACKRFAAWLGRSPETATPDDVKYFQQHLVESGVSICTRNQTMTGVKFLLRVTLRRHDLVAEIFHLKEPVKVPLVLSKDVADSGSNSDNALAETINGLYKAEVIHRLGP